MQRYNSVTTQGGKDEVAFKEFVEILKMPDIQQKHAEVGAEIVASTPDQFHAYLKSEVAKFGKLVKAAGIKAAAGG